MAANRGVNFVRIARQLACSRKSLSPTKIRGFHPGGFPYEAFNGNAFVKPASVLRFIESQRAMSFNLLGDNNLPLLDLHKLYEDFFIFIVATKMEISPQLYDYSIKKGPLYVDLELVNIGSKSFNLKTSVFSHDHDDPLIINYTQSLFVSNKTRRPADAPSWWQEKFSKEIVTHCEPLRLPRLTTSEPPCSSDYSVCVPFSDVDGYFHLNWTNSVKYCYDSYMRHLFQQTERKGGQDSNKNVKCLSVSYLKESTVGDKLNVHIWQCKEYKNIVNFQVIKESGDVANECSMELYS